MNRLKFTGALCILLVLILQAGLSNCYSQTADVINYKLISRGISYKEVIDSQDTLLLHTLRIELNDCDCYVRAEKAQGQLSGLSTVSNMAEDIRDSQYKVIAAINGDFFEPDGEISNNMISEGKYLKAVQHPFSRKYIFDKIHSQFALTYGNKPLIEKFRFDGRVFFKDQTTINISKINSIPDSNSVSLYNASQGEFTNESKELEITEYELVPLKDSLETFLFLVNSAKKKTGKNPLNGNNWILSGIGTSARILEEKVREGDTLRIVLKLDPDFPGIRTLVGGWPRIVLDGVNISASSDSLEGVLSKLSRIRNPRTGIGFSRDSSVIYFFAVDGRRKDSRGMTLSEFADFMIREGAFQGLNLDGGGSTTMYVGDDVVNNPSDTFGERKVGNCLLLMRKETQQ